MNKKIYFALLSIVTVFFSNNVQAQSGCYKPITGNGVQVGTVGAAGGLCVTQLCLGTGYQDLQKVIDNDLNTAASYTNLATILNSNGIAVKNQTTTYPAGYVAGYVFSSASLLNLSLLSGVSVSTYLNGTLQETKAVASLITTTILNTEQRHYVTFITSKPFNEVRLKTTGLSGNLLSGLKVYSALAFPQDCTEATAVNYPCGRPIAGINTDVTFNGAAVCVACNLIDPNNLIDGNRNNYANLLVPASILSSPSVGVINRGTVYPAGFNAGFIVGSSNGANIASASILSTVTIETYLYGQFQESASFTNGSNGALLTLEVLGFTNGTRNKIGFKTTKKFNEVRYRMSQGVNISLSLSRVYYAYAEPGTCVDCQKYLGSSASGKYSGSLVPNNSGLFGIGAVIYNGVYGIALHSLVNAGNATSQNATDYARYNFPLVASLFAGGKVTVKNDGTLFPAGTTAGFEIVQNGMLLGANILDYITISTYKVSGSTVTLQEQNVGSASLLGVDLIGGSTQKASVGFKTTKPFNAIQINISTGIVQVGLGGYTDIYGAYVFEDADGDGVGDCLDICAGDDNLDSDFDGIPDACDICSSGTVAPALAGGPVTRNVCPATTAVLPGVSGVTPAGTALTWHTGAVATNANKVANPAAVGAGVYYAAFYDAAGGCYSPTTADTVKIDNCVFPDLDPDFIFGSGEISGYAPVNVGLKINNKGAAATNPLVPIVVTISAPPATTVLSYDSTTQTITIGSTTISVDNNKWTAVVNGASGVIVLTSKPGVVTIPAQSSVLIGFIVRQNEANFGDPADIGVAVTPVPGETNIDNNADYLPIIYTGGTAGKGIASTGFSALNSQSMTVYPNPATQQITVAGLKEGQVISLYNTMGQALVTRKATGTAEQISIDSYPTGNYILMVRDAGGKQSVYRIQKIN